MGEGRGVEGRVASNWLKEDNNVIRCRCHGDTLFVTAMAEKCRT